MTKTAEEWCREVPFTEWDLVALLRRVQSETHDDFARTFAGHVYVKNEDYVALCRAAKEPGFIREMVAERASFTEQRAQARREAFLEASEASEKADYDCCGLCAKLIRDLIPQEKACKEGETT